MNVFVFYRIDIGGEDITGLQEFSGIEKALEYINHEILQIPVATVDDFTVIEGRERKLKVVERILKVEIA